MMRKTILTWLLPCLLLMPVLLPTDSQAQTLDARGVIKARHRVVLSSEITGKITHIRFRTGTFFKKGQPLIEFDCDLLNAERDKAEGGAMAARAQLKFHKELEALESIGALEVALDQAQVIQKEAQLRIATIAVQRCMVKAPWDGQVVKVLVAEHQGVRAQEPLIEIVATGTMEIEVMVPATWLQWIKRQTPFTVIVDETGARLDAQVMVVGAVVEPVSKMLLLKGRLDQGDALLVPGMGARVVFEK